MIVRLHPALREGRAAYPPEGVAKASSADTERTLSELVGVGEDLKRMGEKPALTLLARQDSFSQKRFVFCIQL